LSDYILRYNHLNETLAKKIIFQVILGVNHSHESGILHRDIKAENIFFKSDHSTSSEIKLTDFGCLNKSVNFTQEIEFYLKNLDNKGLEDYVDDYKEKEKE